MEQPLLFTDRGCFHPERRSLSQTLDKNGTAPTFYR
jgi:hypothetical protein